VPNIAIIKTENEHEAYISCQYSNTLVDKVCERYHRIYLEDRKSNSAKACKCHRRWENHWTTRKNKKSASLLGIVRKSL
jgi:hypothetical protein